MEFCWGGLGVEKLKKCCVKTQTNTRELVKIGIKVQA